MKTLEIIHNTSVSTISTDLSITDERQNIDKATNNKSKDQPHTENELKNDSKQPVWKCRYVPVLILFIVSYYQMYIRLNIGVNIVAMVNITAVGNLETTKSESCLHLVNNSTEDVQSKKKEGEFDWPPKLQGYILGSYFFGQITTQMPAGLLVERYGAKWILFGAALVSGVSALLIPFFSYISVFGLIVLLTIRGLAQGFVFPTIPILAANWFPKIERGFLFSLTKSGNPLGSCFGSIISGFLCDSAGGWSSSFYVTGAMGVLLAVLISIFLFENPTVHPRISQAELNFILNNQENALLRRRPKLPWRKVLKSVPVYALAYAYFGQGWALIQFWTLHSTFLANILHFPIRENGLLTALPFALQFLFSQITSWISLYLEKKKVFGVDFLRKFWNTVACVGYSLCLLGIILSGCNRNISVVFAVLSIGCTGAATSGSWVTPTDMSPTFAGSVQSYCLVLGLISTCLAPVVTGYLLEGKQTIEQWNKVFFLSIGMVLSSAIVFAVFGSAKVQPWNFVEKGKTTTGKDIKLVKNKNDKTENINCEEKTRF